MFSHCFFLAAFLSIIMNNMPMEYFPLSVPRIHSSGLRSALRGSGARAARAGVWWWRDYRFQTLLVLIVCLYYFDFVVSVPSYDFSSFSGCGYFSFLPINSVVTPVVFCACQLCLDYINAGRVPILCSLFLFIL